MVSKNDYLNANYVDQPLNVGLSTSRANFFNLALCPEREKLL